MKYRTIVADPPWEQSSYPTHLGGRLASRDLPYAPMTLDAIRALPVADLASPNGCRLFLWTTSRFLPASFSVVSAWGFDYRQMIVWHKSVNGSPFVTHIAPSHAEFLLVAVVGRPERTGQFPSSVVPVPSGCGGGGRRHSEKPDVFGDLIEGSSPGPYLEMFARRQRLGWDTWGDQALDHLASADGF